MTFCDAIQQGKVLAQYNPFYARHRSLAKDMDRIVAREKELKLRTLSQTSEHLSSCTAELNPQRIDDGNRRRRLGNPASAFSGAIASCWIRRPAAAELPVIPSWPSVATMPPAVTWIQTVPPVPPVEESPAPAPSFNHFGFPQHGGDLREPCYLYSGNISMTLPAPLSGLSMWYKLNVQFNNREPARGHTLHHNLKITSTLAQKNLTGWGFCCCCCFEQLLVVGSI